jgi:hypothetical protein
VCFFLDISSTCGLLHYIIDQQQGGRGLELNSELIAAACQGTAFFISIALLGFMYGQEKVTSSIYAKDPDYDGTKPAWQQPEVMKRAKLKSRTFFPVFWYWGNVRASLLMCAAAVVTEFTMPTKFARAAEIAALIVAATNAGLFLNYKKEVDWDDS